MRALLVGLLAVGLVQSSALPQVSFRVNKVLQVQATGTPAANCQGLRDTLSSLSGPSSGNRHLIRLEPGTYDCGDQTLFVPAGVAIEGAGARVTLIQGQVDNPLLGLVHMVDWSELRSMRVWNKLYSPNTEAIAVSAWEFTGRSRIKLEEVELISNGQLGAGSSLKTIDAGVRISRSIVLSTIRAESASAVLVEHSDLANGYTLGPGSAVNCRLSTDGLVELNASCQ